MERTFTGNELILDEKDYIQSTYSVYTSLSLMKEMLQELVNIPIIKVPFWVSQHKKELMKLGIYLKEEN